MPFDDFDAPSPGEPSIFAVEEDDPRPYPSHRGRRFLVKVVALVLVVGLMLTFPLAYILSVEFQYQRLLGAFVVIEFTVVAVLVAAMRSRRRL
jgi:hypothetical protein